LTCQARPPGRPASDPRDAQIARLTKEKAHLEQGLAKARFVVNVQSKLQPVAALRERGFAGAVRRVSEETFDLLEPVTGVKKACDLTGKSCATVYRRRAGTRSGCRERRPAAPNALSAAERGELLAVLDSPRFRDKAPRQAWALLIDEGIYLASVSTMYRLLREAGQVRERRAQAAHPARKKPELIATGPNESHQLHRGVPGDPQRGIHLPQPGPVAGSVGDLDRRAPVEGHRPVPAEPYPRGSWLR